MCKIDINNIEFIFANFSRDKENVIRDHLRFMLATKLNNRLYSPHFWFPNFAKNHAIDELKRGDFSAQQRMRFSRRKVTNLASIHRLLVSGERSARLPGNNLTCRNSGSSSSSTF